MDARLTPDLQPPLIGSLGQVCRVHRSIGQFPLFCLLAALGALIGCASGTDLAVGSHPPMRALPQPANRPLGAGPAYFVDAGKGDDAKDGSRAQPWKSIGHAVRKLKPGDTLCLRGGVYYEAVAITVAGTVEQPITVRSHPGELAIIDGGLREFCEEPAGAWEPCPDGAAGEFRSTKTYTKGGGFGNFADSMVPFQRYRTLADLRSTNELMRPELSNRSDDPTGIYAGPGVRRDPQTGRIHVRLAHTQLDGLGANHYRGETDPRRIPLVIVGEEYAVRIERAAHVRLQDVVVRGAASAAVRIADSEAIELDGVTLYGSSMALRTSGLRGLRVIRSALRGHAAPWHSRFHHKDRAGSGYLVSAEGRDLEFAHSEFTDHHDFLALMGAEEVRFHHNFVDNFNDDGIEPGPKRERGRIFIYQNHISRCLSPFTAHGKQPNPVAAEEGSGVYLYRNVVDLRRGTYKSPPAAPDPAGKFLDHPTEIIAHEHGSPTLPVYFVYHNTFLLQRGGWRNYYAFTWGAHTRGTTRRVFNNIFAQAEGVFDPNFSALSPNDDFHSDGNLHWSVNAGAAAEGDPFAKFRQSPMYAASRQKHAPGWAVHDRYADPKFVSSADSDAATFDGRLRSDSPAVDAGVAVPATWPDPLRSIDQGPPDIGALPLGVEPFRVGPGSAAPATP